MMLSFHAIRYATMLPRARAMPYAAVAAAATPLIYMHTLFFAIRYSLVASAADCAD